MPSASAAAHRLGQQDDVLAAATAARVVAAAAVANLESAVVQVGQLQLDQLYDQDPPRGEYGEDDEPGGSVSAGGDDWSGGEDAED